MAEYFLSLPENERPQLIISSRYYRCMQTAFPTAKALKLQLLPEPGELCQLFERLDEVLTSSHNSRLVRVVPTSMAIAHRKASFSSFYRRSRRAFPGKYHLADLAATTLRVSAGRDGYSTAQTDNAGPAITRQEMRGDGDPARAALLACGDDHCSR